MYCGPPTWLSVIGENRFWPVAALLKEPARSSNAGGPADGPETPLEMKMAFLALMGFSLFHVWCCWSGSYTGKPAFRAHFAHQGDLRHRILVFCGSCCITLTAMIFGLGSGVFSHSSPALDYPIFALSCMIVVLLANWAALLLNEYTGLRLGLDWEAGIKARIRKLNHGAPEPHKVSWCDVVGDSRFISRGWKSSACYLVTVVALWLIVILPLESSLGVENRELTYWRSMHLFSGLSPVIPVFSVLAGLYLAFWFALHGLALFGPDRPLLPPLRTLKISLNGGSASATTAEEGGKRSDHKNAEKFPLLRMFSQDDAGNAIAKAAIPLPEANLGVAGGLGLALFLAALLIAKEVPIRSVGGWSYSINFLVALDFCCMLILACVWQLSNSWVKLKRLLAFLDRLALRRTLSALHGFSWESVWKMSGNVLEVRYKVISRQIESINHTLATLPNPECSSTENPEGIEESRKALERTAKLMHDFAKWYAANYREDRAGDLTSFHKFQKSVAATSGTLLSRLLIPAWRAEQDSLIADPFRAAEGKDKDIAASHLPRSEYAHIRNAEELVCLTYLGFIQNALGRLRTIVLSIVVLFLASTLAISLSPS